MLLRSCVGCSFSSDYSSVHGESPSAEYAKLRKESLESQFGRMLGSKRISVFYRFGPFLALYRAAIISFYVLKLTAWRFFVHDMNKRSVKVSCDMSKVFTHSRFPGKYLDKCLPDNVYSFIWFCLSRILFL